MITQELLCSRVLLKYKKGQRKLLTDIRRGTESAPLLVLARELYTFSIGYYSKSKGYLKVVKVLPDPLPSNLYFKMTGLVRRISIRRNMSSSKIHCYTD